MDEREVELLRGFLCQVCLNLRETGGARARRDSISDRRSFTRPTHRVARVEALSEANELAAVLVEKAVELAEVEQAA